MFIFWVSTVKWSMCVCINYTELALNCSDCTRRSVATTSSHWSDLENCERSGLSSMPNWSPSPPATRSHSAVTRRHPEGSRGVNKNRILDNPERQQRWLHKLRTASMPLRPGWESCPVHGCRPGPLHLRSSHPPIQPLWVRDWSTIWAWSLV